MQVTTTALRSEQAKSFHYTPYRHMWRKAPDAEPERIYGEVYTSDEYLKKYKELQEKRQKAPAMLQEHEWVLFALMFWSDSTRLANFGNASLWPLYLFFAALSKYNHSMPTSNACSHIAYIPKLPDSFQDDYLTTFGVSASQGVETFC